MNWYKKSPEFGTFQIFKCRKEGSGDFDHFSGFDAGGADLLMGYTTFVEYTDALQIWQPATT